MVFRKTTHPAVYRVYQFLVALKASLPGWAGGIEGVLCTNDEALVKSILPLPAQRQLFARMPPNDQRHALAVARTLRQAGCDHPALMQAALLHDVGKSIGQPIIHRVLIVLFTAFWPSALQWLSTPGEETGVYSPGATLHDHSFIDDIGWWRRPFAVHAHHPALGAAWTQEVGCDPLAVSLIARHQAEPDDESTEEQKLLAVLQWADDLN